MQRIPIEMASPGMVLGKSIYSSSGNILLSAGVPLTSLYIDRLRNLGVPSIYVKDGKTDDIQVADVVSDEVRVATQKLVKQSFADIQKTKMISMAGAKEAINDIIDELLTNPDVIVNLTDIRTYDDYLFGHSVNVCVLSLLIGIVLEYNQIQLRELGIGAVFHDIGKIQIEKSILTKDKPLTQEEFEAIQQHCEIGFEFLRNQEDANLMVAHVAFQHHERFDGKGYPRGLRGQEIIEFARITAVCDVYDSLTADRFYARAYHPSRALLIISEMIGNQLDPNIVRAFMRIIAFYPLGSIVELNSGEIAVVVDNRKDYPRQPIVRLLLNKNHKPVGEMVEIDLVKKEGLSIIRVLNANDPLLPSIQIIGSRLNQA
ncbi:MAG: HD-GYP domain-containing protein [Clostridia bacterium]|nr:HD-GYP domain-containing protein [Clostridia bacterium]